MKFRAVMYKKPELVEINGKQYFKVNNELIATETGFIDKDDYIIYQDEKLNVFNRVNELKIGIEHISAEAKMALDLMGYVKANFYWPPKFLTLIDINGVKETSIIYHTVELEKYFGANVPTYSV